VRAAFELIAWAEAYYKDDQYLEETSRMARQILMEAGSKLVHLGADQATAAV
jgi:hypothetical protein